MGWLFGQERKWRTSVVVAFLVLLGALVVRAADPPALARFATSPSTTTSGSSLACRPTTCRCASSTSTRRRSPSTGSGPGRARVLATLVEKLVEKGAAVIAFDVIFAEPDRSSIGRVLRTLPPDEQTREMRRLAGKFPDNDEVFAAAIRNAPRRHRLRIRPQGRHRTAAPHCRRGAQQRRERCAHGAGADCAVHSAAVRRGEDASTCWRPRPRATAA